MFTKEFVQLVHNIKKSILQQILRSIATKNQDIILSAKTAKQIAELYLINISNNYK